MNKSFLFTVILFCAFLALSCNDQEEINNPAEDAPLLGTVSCSIDTMSWVSTVTSYARLTNSGKTLTVYGTSNQYAVGFRVDSFAFGAHTYSNKNKIYTFSGLFSSEPTDTSKTQRTKRNLGLDTGTVVIESMNVDGIKGSFRFRISIPPKDSVMISSGRFNLNFTSK